MAIVEADIRGRPMNLPSLEFTLQSKVVRTVGNHLMYDALGTRGTVTWSGMPKGISGVTYALDATNGDMLWLPYRENWICSMVLPAVPPAGVIGFATASLSGCKFYVDRVNGSNDLVVSHANAKLHPAPAGSAANYQPPAAIAHLDGLHNQLILDYQGNTPPLAAITPVPHSSVDKARYYKAALMEKKRHEGLGHLNVEFEGGVAVCGFYAAGTGWRVFWQVWGDCSYEKKRPIIKNEVVASSMMRVRECAQIY